MAYPFAAAEVLTAVDLNAMIGAPTQNTQTGTTYTFGLADAGKVNTFDNASPVTATLPAQATVSWPANTVLPVLCLGAGTVTITPAAGVTINGTPLTLATSKGGSLVRTASNVWTFVPFSGGVEAANFTNTATGTYTDGGIDYKYITFTGSGSLVVDQAGFADVLIIGGGGSGSRYSAGGAGGHLEFNNAYLALGTLTVTVGAGGAANSIASTTGNNGIASSVGSYFSPGGGAGASRGINGGSGGGGSTIGLGIVGLGNNGGILPSGSQNTAGGGGGAGAVGGNAVSFGPAGVGGAGRSNSITGTAVTRAGGGGSGGFGFSASGGSGGGGGGSTSDSPAATSGTANTGGGGGGAGYSSSGGTGGAGGSGLVIVRVVV